MSSDRSCYTCGKENGKFYILCKVPWTDMLGDLVVTDNVVLACGVDCCEIQRQKYEESCTRCVILLLHARLLFNGQKEIIGEWVHDRTIKLYRELQKHV
jgi:hypothetical protein